MGTDNFFIRAFMGISLVVLFISVMIFSSYFVGQAENPIIKQGLVIIMIYVLSVLLLLSWDVQSSTPVVGTKRYLKLLYTNSLPFALIFAVPLTAVFFFFVWYYNR